MEQTVLTTLPNIRPYRGSNGATKSWRKTGRIGLGRTAASCTRGRIDSVGGDLYTSTGVCRGSSPVERRPEKAGVASSILAPGTIVSTTYQPSNLGLRSKTFPFRRGRSLSQSSR